VEILAFSDLADETYVSVSGTAQFPPEIPEGNDLLLAAVY
jgi:hypothetical protein